MDFAIGIIAGFCIGFMYGNKGRIISRREHINIDSDSTYDIVGRNVTINGNTIEVDGQVVYTNDSINQANHITINGDVENLTTDKSVFCNDVSGNIQAHDVRCDTVEGNIECQNITCDDVCGDIKATNVTCDDIDGNITAGNLVTN